MLKPLTVWKYRRALWKYRKPLWMARKMWVRRKPVAAFAGLGAGVGAGVMWALSHRK